MPSPVSRKTLTALTVTVLLFFFPATLFAQWGENPDENLVISLKNFESVQPIIAMNPADGGAYVSWFELSGLGGYHVFLQRLDAAGNLLWDSNGIRVAARGFSSTQDYGLSVDAQGNAVLSFRDDRRGSVRVTAAKISPEGTAVWGELGIDVSGPADFLASPAIAATSDGSYVVAYTGAGPSFIVKLDADGEVVWSHQETAGAALAVSDIVASDAPESNGEVIVLFRTFGSPATPGLLSAQKYAADGTRMWGASRVDIMVSGSLQLGNFPDMRADGAGGMIVSWYQSQPALQTYLQQVLADGSFRFQTNGLPLSANTMQLRTDPDFVHDEDSDDIYVFWRETSGNQNQFGLYGQRVSGTGTLEWGDNARTIIPLSGTNVGNIRAALIGGDPLVAYMTSAAFGQADLQAARLDTNGDFAWDFQNAALAPDDSGKNRLRVVSAQSDELFFVWEDERSGVRGIYGQNLQADGSLGPIDEPEPDPLPEVTFQVDMSIQKLKGNFDPALEDRIHVRGTFNDWSVSDENALSPVSDDVPGIYSLTLAIDETPGSLIAYKFYIESGDGRPLPNDGWEGEVGPGENGNREFNLEPDLILPVVFFNNEDEHDTSAGEHESPHSFVLYQNYPNPFNPGTIIAYELPETADVRLELYNAAGQRVAVLVNGTRTAGQHQIYFEADGLASGLYLYRLQAGDQVLTRKMTLIK